MAALNKRPKQNKAVVIVFAEITAIQLKKTPLVNCTAIILLFTANISVLKAALS